MVRKEKLVFIIRDTKVPNILNITFFNERQNEARYPENGQQPAVSSTLSIFRLP